MSSTPQLTIGRQGVGRCGTLIAYALELLRLARDHTRGVEIGAAIGCRPSPPARLCDRPRIDAARGSGYPFSVGFPAFFQPTMPCGMMNTLV
jgi:hypothetical protein